MLSLVAAGRGIAIIPQRMTALGGPEINFAPLSDEDAKSSCALILTLQLTLLSQGLADILIQKIGAGCVCKVLPAVPSEHHQLDPAEGVNLAPWP